MRLAIFGATGGTGLELTKQVLEHGHEARVLARNPNRLILVNERLRIVTGNVLDRESVQKTLLGADAVLSCLGQRTLRNLRTCTLGTQMIMSVMAQQGLRRLVVESAFGAAESWALASLGLKLAIRTVLRSPYEDKNEMEPLVRKSSLDWTIVRPTLLTNGPKTGRVLAGEGLRLALGTKVSRADVADFMLRCVEEGIWNKQAPNITGA